MQAVLSAPYVVMENVTVLRSWHKVDQTQPLQHVCSTAAWHAQAALLCSTSDGLSQCHDVAGIVQARMTQRYGKTIPCDTDYATIATLSLEAREKLALVRLPAAAALLWVLCPASLQHPPSFMKFQQWALSASRATRMRQSWQSKNTSLGPAHAPSRLACVRPYGTV